MARKKNNDQKISAGSRQFADNEEIELHAKAKPPKKSRSQKSTKKETTKTKSKQPKSDPLKQAADDIKKAEAEIIAAGDTIKEEKPKTKSSEADEIAKYYKKSLEESYKEGDHPNSVKVKVPAGTQQVVIQHQGAKSSAGPRSVAYQLPQARSYPGVGAALPGAAYASRPKEFQFGKYALFSSPLVFPGLFLGVIALISGLNNPLHRRQAMMGLGGMLLSVAFGVGILTLLLTNNATGPNNEYLSQFNEDNIAFSINLPDDMIVQDQALNFAEVGPAPESTTTSRIIINATPLGVKVSENFKSTVYASIDNQSLLQQKSQFEADLGVESLNFGNRQLFASPNVDDGLIFDLQARLDGRILRGHYVNVVGERTSYTVWILAQQAEWETRGADWRGILNTFKPDISPDQLTPNQ